MGVDIAQVKRLKDLTGVGLTDAKAALDEANGDFDKALDAMRKKGMTKAEKRGEREARQGVIGTYNHDSRIGVLVEIFTDLVKDVAMHVAASAPLYVSSDEIPADERERITAEFKEKAATEGKPADMIEKIVEGQVKKYFAEKCLLDQPFIKNPDQTVGDYVKEHNARLGENIVVRRFARLALGEVA
jgi:elongation factor Ts